MRSSWQEWVIRIALVVVAFGGAWALWGQKVVAAFRPPPELPETQDRETTTSPALPSGPTQSL